MLEKTYHNDSWRLKKTLIDINHTATNFITLIAVWNLKLQQVDISLGLLELVPTEPKSSPLLLPLYLHQVFNCLAEFHRKCSVFKNELRSCNLKCVEHASAVFQDLVINSGYWKTL